MDSFLSIEQQIHNVVPEASSPWHLLEAGLLCVRQERFVEGLTLLALARERFSTDQAHVAAVLDAFIESHKVYSLAQKELLQASRRFVSADAEQQAQIAALERLLSSLLEEVDMDIAEIDRLQQNARGNRRLYVIRPSPEDLNCSQLSRPLPQRNAGESTSLPALSITCFGRFEVKRLGRQVPLCSNRQGQAILRYLVAQSDHCATSETLMTLLWPEDEPGVAQPRLHTAICALRRSLNDGFTSKTGHGYIVCRDRTYRFDAAVMIQSDVDQFLHCYQLGRQRNEEKIALFEQACHLYTGPFLPEDKYADWSVLQREHLSRVYIDMCKALTDHYLKGKRYEDAEKWATAVLKEDRCDEAAHRQLMNIYAVQGRRSDALQQFQRCERILREELAVQPFPETVQIVQMLLNGDAPCDEEENI
jgi:DNA-binding SARP family transcriptional activator